MDRITSFPWDFVLIGKMVGTLSHWKHSLTERNPPPLQNIIMSSGLVKFTSRRKHVTSGHKTHEDEEICHLSMLWVFKIKFFPAQYVSGNGPFMIQTFITHLSYNLFENNLNQNYGTWIGFNYIVLKEVYVVKVILWILKHTLTAWYFEVLHFLFRLELTTLSLDTKTIFWAECIWGKCIK